jgi:hypothetical protein
MTMKKMTTMIQPRMATTQQEITIQQQSQVQKVPEYWEQALPKNLRATCEKRWWTFSFDPAARHGEGS